MALMSTLVDDFSTKDTTKWSWGAAAADTSGQLVLTPNTSYSGYIFSAVGYDITGSAALVQVVQRADTTGSETVLQLVANRANTNSDCLKWDLVGTSLQASYFASSTQTVLGSVTYSATTHAWWRIREASGTTYWETSPDGQTWTQQFSHANVTFGTGSYTSLSVLLVCGYQTNSGTPSAAKYDNFNNASTNFSGSASFSGSGTLTTTDTPKPAASVSLSGGGTLTASGTPNPSASVGLSSTGTLNAQPGTKWQASGSGTLSVTGSVAVTASASFSGSGILQAIVPAVVLLASEGTLSAVPTGMTVTGGSATFGPSEGQLEASGQGYRHCMTGPVTYDYQPLERAYPHLLTIWIPYGTTVWLDASGVWHDKFWPSEDDLAGAQAVYPGGRCSEPTEAERAAILASPYAEYLHMEELH